MPRKLENKQSALYKRKCIENVSKPILYFKEFPFFLATIVLHHFRGITYFFSKRKTKIYSILNYNAYSLFFFLLLSCKIKLSSFTHQWTQCEMCSPKISLLWYQYFEISFYPFIPISTRNNGNTGDKRTKERKKNTVTIIKWTSFELNSSNRIYRCFACTYTCYSVMCRWHSVPTKIAASRAFSDLITLWHCFFCCCCCFDCFFFSLFLHILLRIHGCGLYTSYVRNNHFT